MLVDGGTVKVRPSKYTVTLFLLMIFSTTRDAKATIANGALLVA
jgi:hypothetical protein